MIVWHGWGNASFAFLLIPFALGMFFSFGIMKADEPVWWAFIPLAAAFAGLNWWLGMKLNQWGPREKVAAEYAGIEQQVYSSVQQGTFSLGPGAPRPRSLQEAQAQAQHYLQQVQAGHRKLFDRNKLFWVPMQHITWVILGLGVVIPIAGMLGQLG